jgi:hypothetical protein
MRKFSNYIAVLIYTLVFSLSSMLAQEITKDNQTEAPQGKPTEFRAATRVRSTTTLTNPLDALRTGKLIYVKSSSLLVGVSVIEEKLQRRREFQQLGLSVTRDPMAADIILELHHDIFTKYVYTAIDPRTEVVIASGKLSSLGGTVAGKVAERFLKQLARARSTPGP